MKKSILKSHIVGLAAVAAACSGAATEAGGADGAAQETTETSSVQSALAQPPTEKPLAEYAHNARRGRIVYVAKGCVLCHAVNGVGGRAAPALDAAAETAEIDAYEFVTRMWRGAPAMVSLQRLELGYQIELDGQDLADLAAFAANPEEQRLLTEKSLPTAFESWFVNERYWTNEEWGEYLEGEEFPVLDDYVDEKFDEQ